MWDDHRRAVKIGRTVNIAQRTASYRANGNHHLTREYARVAGCEWSAADRENKALRLLAAKAERLLGDWFHSDIETAVECVEAACAGYAGKRWK